MYCSVLSCVCQLFIKEFHDDDDDDYDVLAMVTMVLIEKAGYATDGRVRDRSWKRPETNPCKPD